MKSLASEIPNWEFAVNEIKRFLVAKPELELKAKSFGEIYRGKRGLMVVDVICSKQRNYEKRVLNDLLPKYIENTKDLSLKTLAANAPTFLKIMSAEPRTMQDVAIKLLEFGDKNKIIDEDEVCKQWANSETYWTLLQIKGMGPVLLEYLRMLCGVDTIKLDVNVGKALAKLGIKTLGYPTDIVVKVCHYLAKEIGCSLIALDQALFYLGRNNSFNEI